MMTNCKYYDIDYMQKLKPNETLSLFISSEYMFPQQKL